MKFVYCPRCKELRVRPWYTWKAWCSRCRQNAREISVPRTHLTYVLYALIALVFALIYTYTRTDETLFLYAGIGGLVATFIVQGVEISRGERIARARIKATKSDAKSFRKKGWL